MPKIVNRVENTPSWAQEAEPGAPEPESRDRSGTGERGGADAFGNFSRSSRERNHTRLDATD